MALADFNRRNAQAAAHVLTGFDEEAFERVLTSRSVGLAVGDVGREGELQAELLVRLMARLYSTLVLSRPGSSTQRLGKLAQSINPAIEIRSGNEADVGVAVGTGATQAFEQAIFCGSHGWLALLDDSYEQPSGDSGVVFGAGAGACLAAAALFRVVFEHNPQLEHAVLFDTYTGQRCVGVVAHERPGTADLDGTVLVGAGAVGQAAAWALGASEASGTLHIVDDEQVDLGNLQRYVLTAHHQRGASKAPLTAAHFTNGLKAESFALSWAEYLQQIGYASPMALVALDSAQGRRDVQQSLPRAICNAWTQPGDLGVSRHADFGGPGACVSCLYPQPHGGLNEDDIVAAALGVPHRKDQVRGLLYTGAGVPSDLLRDVAAGLNQSIAAVTVYQGRPIRELYRKGVCGGLLMALGKTKGPRPEMHVPLAHQSALAGVLLAAAGFRTAVEGAPVTTEVTRLDVLRPLGEYLTLPEAARGNCICRDPDFAAGYRSKWMALEVAL